MLPLPLPLLHFLNLRAFASSRLSGLFLTMVRSLWVANSSLLEFARIKNSEVTFQLWHSFFNVMICVIQFFAVKLVLSSIDLHRLVLVGFIRCFRP